MLLLMLALWIASAGVVDHSGIKVPFFAFFAHDSGKRVEEAPWNMLLAMGLAAAMCIGIGVRYDLLYAILPNPVDYQPYTAPHIFEMLQLLLFAALAFVVMMARGWYPDEIRSTNLDFDWTYRKAAPKVLGWVRTGVHAGYTIFWGIWGQSWDRLTLRLRKLHRPSGLFGEPWPTGDTALWAAVLLGAILMLL